MNAQKNQATLSDFLLYVPEEVLTSVSFKLGPKEVNMRVNRLALDKAQLSELQEMITNQNEVTVEEASDRLANFFSRVVHDWDVLDGDGEPVSLNVETLKAIDIKILFLLFVAMMQKLVVVPKASKKQPADYRSKSSKTGTRAKSQTTTAKKKKQEPIQAG